MNLRKLYGIGKTHIIDSTAALAATNPVFAFFENVVWGMSDEVSLNARLFATTITYAGLGSLFSRGRDLSRKLLKIKDTASEKIQWLHDTLYLMGVCTVISPIMYAVAGANLQEILEGTITSIGLSTINGYILGYSIDTIRDLTGIKKSERIPRYISDLPSKVKKSLAVFLIAGLVTLNGAIYKITPNLEKEVYQKDSIERIINQE